MDPAGDDWQLLHDYAGAGSQAAFRALVDRHVGMVYSTARRRLGDAHRAEDVTQAVFIILSQKARAIRRGTPLAPWLFNVARHTTANAMKIDRRRKLHEQRAALERPEMVSTPPAEEDERMLALIDGAMDSLRESDRAVILLRFFQGRAFAQIAAALGISAHAAEVRAGRAVEKMRRYFAAHGLPAATGTVAAALTARISDAAPSGVHSIVAAAALGKAAGAPAMLASAATKIGGSLLVKGLVVASVMAAVGVAGVRLVQRMAQSQAHRTDATIQMGAVPNSPLPGAAGAPAGPVPADFDTPTLVRKLMADESWIDSVKSFNVGLEDHWQNPAQRAAAVDQNGAPLQANGRVQMAFDQTRLFTSVSQTNGMIILDVRSWNGMELFDHWIYPEGREKYEIDNSPNHRAISVFVPPIQWPDVAVHNTWWANPATPEERLARVGRPEDYRLTGRQTFRGHDCYEVEFVHKGEGRVKRILMAGVADQRVYGLGGEEWYDDYREVAPGRWMPMSMGYTGRTMKVTSIEVDQPLPDSLFERKYQVGAQVTDFREDTYLSYTYKENMTADEWANIRADAKARAAREAATPLQFGGPGGGALRALAERRAKELAGRPATQPASVK